MGTNRMVYIKDYQRAEEREKEEEIYQSLEKKNISRFYCKNNVCYISEICEKNVSQEGYKTVL